MTSRTTENQEHGRECLWVCFKGGLSWGAGSKRQEVGCGPCRSHLQRNPGEEGRTTETQLQLSCSKSSPHMGLLIHCILTFPLNLTASPTLTSEWALDTLYQVNQTITFLTQIHTSLVHKPLRSQNLLVLASINRCNIATGVQSIKYSMVKSTNTVGGWKRKIIHNLKSHWVIFFFLLPNNLSQTSQTKHSGFVNMELQVRNFQLTAFLKKNYSEHDSKKCILLAVHTNTHTKAHSYRSKAEVSLLQTGWEWLDNMVFGITYIKHV